MVVAGVVKNIGVHGNSITTTLNLTVSAISFAFCRSYFLGETREDTIRRNYRARYPNPNPVLLRENELNSLFLKKSENFVKSITPVLDNRLAQKFPVLAKCITAEHILDMYKHDGLKGLASRRSSMNTIPIELASVASISPQTSHPHFPAVNQSNLSNVSDVSKGSSNNSAHLNNHESTSGHTPTRMVPGVAGAPMRTFSVESFNTSSSPGSMNNLHKAGVGMPSTTSLEDEGASLYAHAT